MIRESSPSSVGCAPLIASLVVVAAAWAAIFVWQPVRFWIMMTLAQLGMITAAVCGLFWALVFAWRRSLFAVIVSHAVWDAVVMVIAPIV